MWEIKDKFGKPDQDHTQGTWKTVWCSFLFIGKTVQFGKKYLQKKRRIIVMIIVKYYATYAMVAWKQNLSLENTVIWNNCWWDDDNDDNEMMMMRIWW